MRIFRGARSRDWRQYSDMSQEVHHQRPLGGGSSHLIRSSPFRRCRRNLGNPSRRLGLSLAYFARVPALAFGARFAIPVASSSLQPFPSAA